LQLTLMMILALTSTRWTSRIVSTIWTTNLTRLIGTADATAPKLSLDNTDA
jgi:hypothetical protein